MVFFCCLFFIFLFLGGVKNSHREIIVQASVSSNGGNNDIDTPLFTVTFILGFKASQKKKTHKIIQEINKEYRNNTQNSDSLFQEKILVKLYRILSNSCKICCHGDKFHFRQSQQGFSTGFQCNGIEIYLKERNKNVSLSEKQINHWENNMNEQREESH